MAIQIIDVKIKTNYDWQNVKELGDWQASKNTNSNWQQLSQTTVVGKQITIEVEIVENSWAGVKERVISWQDIKTEFTNWLGLKNI